LKFLIAVLLLGSCASYSPVPEELPEKPVGEVTPVEVPGEDVPPKDIVARKRSLSGIKIKQNSGC